MFLRSPKNIVKLTKPTADGKFLKLYYGYGHTRELLLYGHLLKGKPLHRKGYSTNIFTNIFYLLRLFFVKPVPLAPVTLYWNDQVLNQTTETDGFIKFEWSSNEPVAAGWHPVRVGYREGTTSITGDGHLFVPHITQYAFISDIDDTILVSHSSTVLRRLRALFTANPHTRKLFPEVDKHYRLLSLSNTTDAAPNPFFYVSSSEWNLYDYLDDFFTFHQLPKGAFLLNHLKQWTELLKTGKTKHEGKLIRVARILKAFPNQHFVLLGDNSQRDPVIYKAIAEKYTGRIHAIYIRNVNAGHAAAVDELLTQLQRELGVHTCQYTHSSEAIAHSRSIGLIALSV